MNFLELRQEIKRRATRDQGGSQFDSAVNNAINLSLLRIAREANWRVLRRTSTIDTKTTYSKGSGSATFTSGDNYITVTGANFITDGIEVGRYISIGSDYYHIKQITSETSCNIDKTYNDTTVTTSGDYSILPQEIYNLPVQCGHRMFLWHREYGYPYQLVYMTEQEFRDRGIIDTDEGVPTHYRMWGEDMAMKQMLTDSNLVLSSTALTADTSTAITIFGIVAGYPDSETLTASNSASNVRVFSTKKFSFVERIVKAHPTTGRTIISASGRNSTTDYTVGIIPAGNATEGVLYKKIRLYPLPDSVFPIQVWYYKEPYKLYNDKDVHELGPDFDEAIILMASAKVKYETDQNEGDKFLALYTDEIRNLRKTNIDKIDYFPTLHKQQMGGNDLFAPGTSYRQVGPNFGPSARF